MQQLALLALNGRPTRVQPDRPAECNGFDSVRIDQDAAGQQLFGLWIDPDGQLSAAPLHDGEDNSVDNNKDKKKDNKADSKRDNNVDESGDGDEPADGGPELVAGIKCLDEDGTPAWYLAVRGDRLGVNGTTPPLGLVRLEPGSLMSHGRRFWTAAHVWQPEPRGAPEELADQACPVCGLKLSEAPIVQCPGPGCGRRTHLEDPENPDNDDALNCYLATEHQCPDCKHPATLEPIVVPEPHEKLLPAGAGGPERAPATRTEEDQP
jgi:hypothetical protein